MLGSHTELIRLLWRVWIGGAASGGRAGTAGRLPPVFLLMLSVCGYWV